MTIHEPYLTNYGTRFGAYHSAVDFGLYPRSKPVITAPEIQSNELEVPGRDTSLRKNSMAPVFHSFPRQRENNLTAVGLHD